MKQFERVPQAKDLNEVVGLRYTMTEQKNDDSECRERSAAMQYRQEKHGKIAITQPTYAWLSGQLARAWGNIRFGEVAPWEEVCLGAEQHDVGHIV
jgi:hypothetical protein